MFKAGCRFCRIKDVDLVIETGNGVTVILSNPRLIKGHLLVIPESHVESPWELTPAQLINIYKYIWKYQEMLSNRFGTGCDVRQNYRPFLREGTLKVDHLHFHLIPRMFEDDLYTKCHIYEKDVFTKISEKERQEVISLMPKES